MKATEETILPALWYGDYRTIGDWVRSLLCDNMARAYKETAQRIERDFQEGKLTVDQVAAALVCLQNLPVFSARE